ncbi:hypothetical protein [Arcicella rosea]|uniref:DUF3828 domain-containing protein n=1 Tax=Arcicella rosea TaxID=502909 RepID=A0A841ENI1_9BACT|nr:hypothetical protein [Arcicella rosea]MBB6005282.1 hypothetical protein [Arcicella rosea]
MKRYNKILLVSFLSIFSLVAKAQAGKTKQSHKFTIYQQPTKTIIDFLKWYRNNLGIQGNLLKTNPNLPKDTVAYYSVNFLETEKYLSKLQSTGFISDKYINKWRVYFKKCEQNLKENPQPNDGPADGFDFDFIMLGQEYNDDLDIIEKAKIKSLIISNKNAIIKLYFSFGNEIIYNLTQYGDKWQIDDITRKHLPSTLK